MFGDADGSDVAHGRMMAPTWRYPVGTDIP